MSESDHENDYTLVFDHFYTTNHIQILKSLLPFFDTGASSYLPVLIKYLELQHTINLAQKGIRPLENGIKAACKQAPDFEAIYKAIKKYLAPDEENSLQQIINMLHTMESIKEMQKMMEFFQSMNSDDNTTNGGFDIDDLFGGNFNMGDMMQFFNNTTQ